MQVLRITPRGYCHGVVEALRVAKRAREATDGPVHMLGLLVHNTHVTDELEKEGVVLVDAPSPLAGVGLISRGTVILNAHGVSPEVRRRAAELGLTTVDATCSDVARTHHLVRDLAARGYEVVCIGRRGHPEPEGILGEAPGHVHLVEDVADVENLDLPGGRPLAVTCQTTLSVWDTAALIDALRQRYPGIEVYNEICRATQDRQEAAVAAARDVDVVIVVGSPRSSNSNRLVDVVRERTGRPAYLVDRLEDIDPDWFEGVRTVGVTSGASTPSQLTRRVIQHLELLEPPSAPIVGL